ncbi:Poly(A) polymerase [Coemansia spiralis]|nr:Poly(A) polymerase [Coemansia spiralis]
MSTETAAQPAAASAADDYIKLGESSEGEATADEGSEGADVAKQPAGSAGTKRKHSDDDGDGDDNSDGGDGTGAAVHERCYNGIAVPQWLQGARRLGRGKRPDANEILNEEMTRFIAYISPTPEEHQMRGWVIERLQLVLATMRLPRVDAVAKCFGSFETQLYLPTSDIDMTVMLYETGTTRVSGAYLSKEAIRRFLYTLAQALKQSGFCKSCEVIAHARVPIIKTREAISGIAVDISINADSGMRSAAVQRSFAEKVYPNSLRALVLTIKQFLYQRSMNEVYTGGMGSYAITLLAVSLLQLHPRVRSGGLDVEKNTGVLLVEFFELYGKRFNYDNACVSVLDSGRYVPKRTKGFYSPSQPYLLSIEDPADPTNDVTKGTYGINRIKQTFGGAYDLLNNAIFAYHQTRKFGKPINETLQSIAGSADGDGAAAHKRARGSSGGRVDKTAADALTFNDDPWAPVSFLSSIVKIDSSIIAMRAKLVKTFHSGAMQRVLGTQHQPQLVRDLPAQPPQRPDPVDAVIAMTTAAADAAPVVVVSDDDDGELSDEYDYIGSSDAEYTDEGTGDSS